jgi:6-phosphogluconolactonase
MVTPELIICRDADELATAAARVIRRCAASRIVERGRFTLALAGGSTPKQAYRLLAHDAPGAGLDWSKVYLFFGDERWVPPDDERSNYKMVRESLLAVAPIAADHLFAVPTRLASARECAASYADTLNQFFGTTAGRPPIFDLILLGLGDDGHTASLFPGAASLAVAGVPVTFSPPGSLPPPVDRITLTYPVLNAARHVLFLVAGASKAAAFRDVWEGRVGPDERPAAGVHPDSGTVTWLVDEAAARLVQSNP